MVMGVTGSGKTTIATLLAEALHARFVDGDTLHPLANIAKMHAGHPLDDSDREPWLSAVASVIDAMLASGEAGVVTCSALKRTYRERLIGSRPEVTLCYLRGDRALLADRLAHREGHFMPAALLDSQLQTLEEPGAGERPLTVGIDRPARATVDAIVAALRARYGA